MQGDINNMLDMMTQLVYTIGKKHDSSIEMLGTGFLVGNGKYVVTARHVVGDANDGLVIILPSIRNFAEYQDTTINTCNFADVHRNHSDPLSHLVPLDFPSPVTNVPIPTPTLGSTDDIHVGEEIYILGFPHCVEGRRVLTMQNAMIGS